MIEFLLALAILLVLVAGMAIGVLLGRKPLAGSCGGVAALGMDTACEICGGIPPTARRAGSIRRRRARPPVRETAQES